MDANRTCESVRMIDLGVLIKQAVMVYFTDTCFIDTKAKAYNFFRIKLKKPWLIQIVLHWSLSLLIASKANDFE